MTESNTALEEALIAKLEADQKSIDMIVDDVNSAFSDPNQASIIQRIAIKTFHNTTDINEMNVQGMYTSTVLDALAKILIEDLNVIDKEAFKVAVQEAYDVAMQSMEDAQNTVFDFEDKYRQNLNDSEVQTI